MCVRERDESLVSAFNKSDLLTYDSLAGLRFGACESSAFFHARFVHCCVSFSMMTTGSQSLH